MSPRAIGCPLSVAPLHLESVPVPPSASSDAARLAYLHVHVRLARYTLLL